MTPLFYAFDRQNYSYLTPAHIRMLHTLPKYIVDHFKSGAFVSSITGTNFSEVGSDEAHEMLINIDCKSAFSHHLPLHVEKHVLHCSAKLSWLHNLKNRWVYQGNRICNEIYKDQSSILNL